MGWSSLGLWRRNVCWLATAACLASSARAQTEPGTPSWLEWHGPIECQNTREVERELASLLGRDPDPAGFPPTRVDLGWTAERGWTLRIHVLLPGGEREREVDVHTCIDGFDVVALTLALILDPSLRDPADPQGGAAAANDVPASPRPPSAASPAASAPSSDEPSAGAAAPLPPVPRPPDEAEQPPHAATGGRLQRPPAFALTLSGNARTDLGSLPASLYGGGLELGWAADDLRLDTGAGFLMRSDATLPSARYPVSYSNLFGILRGCWDFQGERGGYFGTCAGGQLGSLAAREHGGAEHAGHGLWAAANAGAELGLSLNSLWAAFSRLELTFPLVKHQFMLDGGSVAYELPAVTVQLAIGAALTLTDSGKP
jgi:hypothetical protein